MSLTTRTNPQLAQGFSLLELLVVIVILAALGGGAIVAAGNMRENALRQIAIMEMQKIKQALLRYRQDVGNWPQVKNPADFFALYERPTGPSALSGNDYDLTVEWDIASARGWRGPYLTALGEGYLNSVIFGAANNPQRANPMRIDVHGVADPFVAAPVKEGGYSSCANKDDDDCLFAWNVLAGGVRHERWGRPFLLFDLSDSNKARLVSMGPDGRYDGTNAANACVPNGDDLVLCLLR